ncbi:hypothetical protein QN277_015077 [Acacia crassicarpa]|uniref:Tocopherol cyclase n=1 Tax=Acacia crassicarpa TaxID=499986 RepID=A0AAE1JZQ2_9FABA|nr:hypothetical protein QN277_015077 [Acacia crassicarpa]
MESQLCSRDHPLYFSPNFGFSTVNLIANVKPPQTTNNGFHRGSLKLGFRSISRFVAYNSVSVQDSSGSSTIKKGDEDEALGSARPTYVPTPPNRALRTPHSGYHFDGTTRKFFEVAQYGPRSTGVGAQILGADDKYICQYSEESQNFWGSRHELILGSTFVAKQNMKPPNSEVPPQEFEKRVSEGFQVTPLWHQGFIRDDGRSDYVETVKSARWEYSTRPVYGWGDVGSTQKSTAGWLAAFPVFEPHWQMCMAGGLSTGWIEWDGEMIEFENAPSYSEKNWGGGFPRKWFWVQCNVFEGGSGEIALTAAGGLRQLPGLTDNFENAALIGVHYGGTFYEFVPWNGVVNWEIAPWGYWFMSADNGRHVVELEATTEDPGTVLRAPTSEAGFSQACKDTCFGVLKLQMWERRYDGSKGKKVLDVTSNMAALEVGGGPWFNTWKGQTSTPEIVRGALGLPVDVDGIFNLVPFLKPPGL